MRELGGLYVLGTERHEARRIDNQLRGRSGRQGDPGETRFYLSGQDDLVRLFAGDRIYNIMERFKLPDDQPMEAKILSNQIENAQKKVEEQNFVQRKNVLKYDDVMNVQRKVIYEQRRAVLEGAGPLRGDQGGVAARGDRGHRRRVHRRRARGRLGPRASSSTAMERALRHRRHRRRAARGSTATRSSRSSSTTRSTPTPSARRRSRGSSEGLMRDLERFMVLQVVDVRWREHLENMDYMREGIHLRGMAQKDPLVEYRNEGHVMFLELNRAIREEVRRRSSSTPQIEPADASSNGAALPATPGCERRRQRQLSYEHETLAGAEAIVAAGAATSAGGAQATVGGEHVAPQPVVKSEQREHRPQRPVLVRLGQEVQALPRRVTARS